MSGFKRWFFSLSEDQQVLVVHALIGPPVIALAVWVSLHVLEVLR